jgi:hypothetical protein
MIALGSDVAETLDLAGYFPGPIIDGGFIAVERKFYKGLNIFNEFFCGVIVLPGGYHCGALSRLGREEFNIDSDMASLWQQKK